MSLEQGLHQRWAATSALTTRLPAAKFFTGQAVGDIRRPYAVWERTQVGSQIRTSDSTVRQVHGVLHLWTDSLAQGREIAAAFANAFDRQTFALAAGELLSFRVAALEQQVTDEGAWHLQIPCILWLQDNL